MLIRTQDKRSLVEITGIKITINQYPRYAGTPKEFYVYNIEYPGETLGRYTSYEKAIKVLDMIQEYYLSPIVRNVVGENEVEIYQNKVFEMPADEEVNV